MKLALILPPQPYLVTHHVQAPLGLLYLSAIVKRDVEGWETEVWDFSAGVPERIPAADVYGFTANTLDWAVIVALKERIAKEYPEAEYIVGGPHVTAIPSDGAEHFDAVFQGEAEYTLPAYLADTRGPKGEVHRAAVRCDLDALPYPDRQVALNSLPYPNRDALPWLGGKVITRGGTSIGIMASRGCPFNCAFCSSKGMWPGGVRWRSPGNVVDEIKYCIEKYGVRIYRFTDDNMTSNREWTLEFCEKVTPLGISWRLPCRVDRLDPELLRLMRQAGCEEMGLGIESFDQTVLDAIDKRQTVEQARQAVNMVHDAGIGVRLLLMITTPGETYRVTVQRNIRALEKLRGKFVVASMMVMMPLPGARIWDTPERFGVSFTSRNISRFNYYVYQRAEDGAVKMSTWSPLAIDGMTQEHQDENARTMIAFMATLPENSTGRL